jgi:hypothetical protein
MKTEQNTSELINQIGETNDNASRFDSAKTQRIPRLPVVREPDYSLRKDLGFWRLRYGGKAAILKHEKGLSYVHWLLTHPDESLQAFELAARVAVLEGARVGVTEIRDPRTGRTVIVESNAVILERSLGLDEAEGMRKVLRKQAELEAYVDDENTTDPERAEAYEDLIALYEYEKVNSGRVRDVAAKASDAVGKAIKRLQKHCMEAKAANGAPNPVLQAFGAHILDYILAPSGRSLAHCGMRPKGYAGMFVYQGSVVWNG